MSRFLKVMIVLLAIAAFAAPAFAETTFYGSARMSTFYNDLDEAGESLTWALQGNSRFGMKASKDNIGGRFEVGTGVNLRLLFGTYKFDGGSLLIGQTYTPWTKFSNQAHGADNGFISYGATYDGREPMIKLTFDPGFYVAAVRPEDSSPDEVSLPKLGVGYMGKAGSFSYGANLGFQSYDDAAGESVDSILATFNGDVAMNPVTITFNVAIGQNAGEFGILGATEEASDEDTEFVSGFAQVAFKASDMHKIAGGVGVAIESNDAWSDDAERMSAFVQDTITIAPGFFIVPELSIYDMTAGNGAETESFHVGAKWQINF